MVDHAPKNESHIKLINIMCKFKNLFKSDKLISGISNNEFIIMLKIDDTVKENNVATVSNIAREMRTTNAAVSKTIGQLEDEGYVVKLTNKDDKRQSYISITDKGRKQLDLVGKELDSFSDAVFNKYGKEKTNQLIDLLDDMYQIVLEEIKTKQEFEKGNKKIKSRKDN